MPFDIPQDRLRAMAEAWPLRSSHCFDAATLALPRRSRGSAEHQLVESFNQELRAWAGGLSLDGIGKLRELAWFGETSDDSIELHAYLGGLAARHLRLEGAGIRLRWDDGDEQSMLELQDAFRCARSFRWLSLSLPGDLLVAALTARERQAARSGLVSLVTPALRRVLERPVAQSHLHVGAAIGFPHIWTSLMARLASPSYVLEEQLFKRGGPPPFKTARGFCMRLVQAALIRLLLASFLRSSRARPLFGDASSASFTWSWLSQPRRLQLGWSRGEAMRELERARISLCAPGEVTDKAVRLQRLYRQLAPVTALRVEHPADIVRADPLFGVLAAQAKHSLGSVLTLPESHFSHQALTYLAEPKPDRDFARLFWQYQRIRCATYAHLTQAPGTSGLDWFTRHYDRISALRGEADDFIVSFALAADAREANLSSLEARTSPPNQAQKVVDLLRSYAGQAARYEPPRGVARPEFGVVLHFLKAPDPNATPVRRRQRGFAFGRYAAWFLKRWREALAVEAALKWRPDLLLVLRGVDVCNVELALPTWTMLPLFEKVRQASQLAAEQLDVQQPLWRVEPLRATCHVGEEYRRLVEGLRRMHEVLFHGLVRRGDRVGHGLALARDPERWATIAPMVAQPREDRLDDLLWELDRYADGSVEPEPGRIERVRNEVRRHGTRVYDNDDVDVLCKARLYRYSPKKLKQLNYPYVRPIDDGANMDAATRLLHRYLKDYEVWRRGQEPVEIPVDKSEVRLLGVLQSWLRREYAKLEITIETNPSSNLVVADHRDIGEHAAFVLRPLTRSSSNAQPSLPISINTDDPVTFATSLADEYAHIYFAMLGNGVCAQEAMAWLDEVRECGWSGRFTLAASRDISALLAIAQPRRR